MRHRLLLILACVASAGALHAPTANAGIIKIQDVQTCKVDGLDSSTDAVQGGVHCIGGQPISLSGILDGSISLLVGNDQTPSWNIINDTGSTIFELSLWFTGSLAENAFIDMQVSDDLFLACVSNDGLYVNSDPKCGSKDKTVKPEDGGLLPLLLTWSGGLGLKDGMVFNLGTASFAHSGDDAGCLSGARNCSPVSVPEPGTLALLGIGLAGLALMRRRLKI